MHMGSIIQALLQEEIEEKVGQRFLKIMMLQCSAACTTGGFNNSYCIIIIPLLTSLSKVLVG
jgi:hypothetical protein